MAPQFSCERFQEFRQVVKGACRVCVLLFPAILHLCKPPSRLRFGDCDRLLKAVGWDDAQVAET